MKENIFWRVAGFFVIFAIILTSCGPDITTSSPTTAASVTPTPTPSETPETPSQYAQDISNWIASVNTSNTTALANLFRISDELDKAQSNGWLTVREMTDLQADLMKKLSDWVDTREERLGLNNLPPALTGHITWSANDSALMAGANERIEQYREGNATISVVDASGKPVTDAVVRLDMLKHDFLFGTGLGWLDFFASPTYRDTLARLFNYATINIFWRLFEPVRGQTDLAYPIEQARWAKDCGMTVEGHNLIYIAHDYTFFPAGPPDWVKQLLPEEVDGVLHGLVNRVVTKFNGLVDYWIALNEPTQTDKMVEPLRSWMMSFTPAGAEALTLEWAHATDPEPKLIINDWEAHPEEFHQLLKDVVAAGAPFDAIGFQTYMVGGRWTLKKMWDIFELLKDFNKPLQLTELEVDSGDPNNSLENTPEGEAIQAEYVSAFYTLLFSHPSTQAITWFFPTDLNMPVGPPGGLLRKDLTPKLAYEQLMKLIHKDWWTNAKATTNAQGKATIRGFYGQYLLTIESGTQKIQKIIHLEAGQDNIFEVQLP